MICKSFTKLIPSKVSKWVSVIRALLKLTPKKYSLQQLDERAVKPSLVARLCSNARRSNSSMHGALCRCRVGGGLPRVRYTLCRLGEAFRFCVTTLRQALWKRLHTVQTLIYLRALLQLLSWFSEILHRTSFKALPHEGLFSSAGHETSRPSSYGSLTRKWVALLQLLCSTCLD